jgi:multisubunit Na+/H+ antiporter MnhF subunit
MVMAVTRVVALDSITVNLITVHYCLHVLSKGMPQFKFPHTYH